jgi:hypothetical protein
MANQVQHQALKQALNEGVRSLKKWYDRVDGTSSPAYFICLGMSLHLRLTTQTCTYFSILVLDPTVKDLYFRRRWSNERYAAGMGKLEEVVSDSIECVLYTDFV